MHNLSGILASLTVNDTIVNRKQKKYGLHLISHFFKNGIDIHISKKLPGGLSLQYLKNFLEVSRVRIEFKHLKKQLYQS